MADSIFVGEVAVGVVPDLRGFNDKMRRELVPEANRIGSEIGREMARGIAASLGIGRTVRDAVVRDARAISEAGTNAGRMFAVGFRNKVNSELRGFRPTVTVEAVADTTVARAEIARLSGTVTENVRTRGGGILGRRGSGIGSDIGGLAGLAGGAANVGGGAASSFGNLTGVFAKLPPEMQAALIGAALAVAPFIGQIVAGGIVTALGSGIIGLAIAGAMQDPIVTQALDRLKSRFKEDLQIIGMSFVPVMESVFNTIRQTMDKLTPVFKHAADTLAGPFRAFADTLIRSFGSPEVQKSVQAIATAFGGILKALTPQIPAIMGAIANSITAIANTITNNPEAFAGFIKFLIGVVNFGLRTVAVLSKMAVTFEKNIDGMITAAKAAGRWISEHWQVIWGAMVRAVTDAVGPITVSVAKILTYVIQHWRELAHDTAVWFDRIRHGIANQWNLIYHDTIGNVIRLHQWIQRQLNSLFHNIASLYDQIRHAIASSWDAVWSNTVVRAQRGVRDIVNIFIGLKNWVISFFSSAGSWLYNAGRNIMTGLWSGIRNVWNDVVGWFKGMPHAILHALGIASPPPWSIDAGKFIMSGILKGLAHGAIDVKGFFVNLASDVTGPLRKVWHGIISTFKGGPAGHGVEQWLPQVKIALMLNNLSDSLAGQVLYQMRSESGGNRNAINLWDINAQRGDPSKGLMQVIGSTFAAYHVPGTSGDIYDPIANIAAAINYARHIYGPSLMSGGMGLGSGRGYDSGGWLPTGLTLAHNLTGSPELVLNQAQLADYAASMIRARGGPEQPTYVAHFDSLTGEAIESHVRIAFQAMSLNQGHLNRQGRRS